MRRISCTFIFSHELKRCQGVIEEPVLNIRYDPKTVWSGVVSVFEIKEHSQAEKCYTWSSPMEGSTRRQYYAVFHFPLIDSPEKAVRASIFQDYTARKLK